MNSERCETCRFWEPVKINEKYPDLAADRYFDVPGWVPGTEEYEADAVREEWGELADWGTCVRQDHRSSPMFTNDASDFFSALRTKSTHHCGAWE
jgi:hypothetical protein